MAYPSPHQARCSVCEGIAWLCPHDWALRYAQAVFELECCVHPRPDTQEHAALRRELQELGLPPSTLRGAL